MNTLGKEVKESHDEQFLSLLLTIIFTILLIGGLYILRGKDLSLTVFEFIIISLAVFRLIRLIVYDSIAQFIRDIFLDKVKKVEKKTGMIKVSRHLPKSGIKRKITQLLQCPWCTGVWIALFVLFFHYYCPYAFYVYILLAIAGVGSYIQLTANIVGKYGH
jgi:hypothetical protein|tara:strand:- start:4462 stop:4944 length:483 start_codon:yes stop_codon:yes gene_type:complete